MKIYLTALTAAVATFALTIAAFGLPDLDFIQNAVHVKTGIGDIIDIIPVVIPVPLTHIHLIPFPG